jgi:hypothetical protein
MQRKTLMTAKGWSRSGRPEIHFGETAYRPEAQGITLFQYILMTRDVYIQYI